MFHSNYDKQPFIAVPDGTGCCVEGWDAVCDRLNQAVSARGAARTTVTVECYTGVFEDEIVSSLQTLGPVRIVRSSRAFHPPDTVDQNVAPFDGGDDPVFGWMTNLRMSDFLDQSMTERLAAEIAEIDDGLVIVLGSGASLIHSGDILVYADLARWEAQMRMRRDEISNLGVENRTLKWNLQYKRAFFTDWRVCDRLKRELMGRWDFVLDTNKPGEPRLADGNAVRTGLKEAACRPFRVVPFFDPAPWGGQWMKEVCDLDRSVDNYGWCFDCVPEEDSLLLKFGDTIMELPSIDVAFQEPRALLGERVHARFGDEFPIRFDFLDTMGGGHLSFQVHPLTEYIQQHFGMHYTQDESYYLLDAGADATVYLGTKEGVDPDAMAADLQAAQRGEAECHEQARQVLGRIFTTGAEEEFKTITATVAEESAEKSRFADLLQKRYRKPLIVAMALAAFAQFSGINVVFYYGTSMLETAGFKSDSALSGLTTERTDDSIRAKLPSVSRPVHHNRSRSRLRWRGVRRESRAAGFNQRAGNRLAGSR